MNDILPETQVYRILQFTKKVVARLWKILRSRRGLGFLLCYAICSSIFVSFIKSKIYPEGMDCFVYNDMNLRFNDEFSSKIDANLNIYLKKYLDYDNCDKNKWTEVTQDIFVYSAYIDICPPNIAPLLSLCVIFIGIALNNTNDVHTASSKLNCAMKRRSDVKMVGSASIEIIPENHFKPYTAAFFYCHLKEKTISPSWPDHVTLFRSSISIWVPVKYLAPSTSSSNVVTSLCVRPLYGFYSSLQFTEFLAYYSTMGIKHFIFYHQNISDSMCMFLMFLKSTNLSIELLSWDIPLNNDLIHEYGQMVFTQDCIVRSKYKFSHTIIVDMDEFIVPKLHSSITDLILYLDNKYEDAGSYSISMVLFCEEFSYEKKYSLLFPLFSSNKRQKTPWTHGFRSKYIARPDRVRYGGIHFVWKHERSWFEVKVSDSTALLHHYRQCCGLLQTWFFNLFCFHVLKDDVVIDNSLVSHSHKALNHSLVTFLLSLMNYTTSHNSITTTVSEIF